MKHTILLLSCAATANAVAPTATACTGICDRTEASKECFVGTPSLKGGTCTTTRDCVNGELSADALEPYWIRDDRHNTEKGLTCYNPTGAINTGVCMQRFVHGQRCHTDDNCESRFCVKELYGREIQTCAAYDSIASGEPCPYNNPLGEDRVHSICHGKAHCYQADGTLPPGQGVAVCKDWDEEDRECYILYNVDGVTIKGDTCDPFGEDLVCIPLDTSERPPLGATSLDQLSIKGICREKQEAEDRASCAPYEGTNKRPYCKFDKYCDEKVEIDSNGQWIDNSVCSFFAKTDEVCTNDNMCKYGLGCNFQNVGDETGLCKRILDGEEGFITTRDIFCAVGWERNAENVCVPDRSGQTCSIDADCFQGTPDGTRYPSRMFCDTRVGGCRDVISHDCDTEYEDYMEFLFNYKTKTFGRILDRVQCTDDSYDSCFSPRGTLKKMRNLGNDLNCCAYRKANDDNTCFKIAEDIVFFPDSASGWFWAADADDQEGDVCVDTSISAATLAIIIVLFVFLCCMMMFILIKEYYWHPKYGQKIGDGSSKSSSSSSSSSEVQADQANDDFDSAFGEKVTKSDKAGAKGEMTTE